MSATGSAAEFDGKPWKIPNRVDDFGRFRCIPSARIPATRCAPTTRGSTVRLSGWVHRKRDHGNLLRDRYGVTQCVAETGNPAFAVMDAVRLESVLTVTGPDVERSEDTVNLNLPTGHVEVKVAETHVESAAASAESQRTPPDGRAMLECHQ